MFENAIDVQDRRAADRAIAVSAVGLGVTGIVELAVALATGSVALLGDALHNLSDVSTSAVVFLGFRISRRAATARYPYGYERAEDLAGLGIALVIWASAVFAAWQSWHKLVDRAPTDRLPLGMAAAVVGIVGNQAVARYKARIGRRIRSATLIADAEHSRLDALSSAGALGGLLLVAAGRPWGDPIAGLGVTVLIAHAGWEITADMVHRLMDGADVDRLRRAEAAVRSVPGVGAVTVRGRWTGRSLRLDICGRLDPDLPLHRADRIGCAVRDAVREVLPEARAVTWTPSATGPVGPADPADPPA